MVEIRRNSGTENSSNLQLSVCTSFAGNYISLQATYPEKLSHARDGVGEGVGCTGKHSQTSRNDSLGKLFKSKVSAIATDKLIGCQIDQTIVLHASTYCSTMATTCANGRFSSIVCWGFCGSRGVFRRPIHKVRIDRLHSSFKKSSIGLNNRQT